MKKQVAALIPAHNEEAVIEKTLFAILQQCDPQDIYIVDDGSTDGTSELIKKYTLNILRLPVPQGKAEALNLGLEHFKLPDSYEYIFFMDADTRPAADFVEQCLKHLKMGKNKNVPCVVGSVKGLGGSWVGKYRMWEYEIGHAIHKKAQNHLRGILVLPGCATLYRSSIFQKIRLPSGTLTEDMDFTFLLHRQGYSNMIFEENAVVYTIDPQNLKDFISQMGRWYTGFWQAARKHDLPWHGQALDFEVMVLGLEGLVSGIIGVILVLTLPLLTLTQSLSVLQIPIAVDFFGFFIPTLVWTAYKIKNPRILLYVFPFYFMRFLTSILFLYGFFIAYRSNEKVYTWDTKRYILNKK